MDSRRINLDAIYMKLLFLNPLSLGLIFKILSDKTENKNHGMADLASYRFFLFAIKILGLAIVITFYSWSIKGFVLLKLIDVFYFYAFVGEVNKYNSNYPSTGYTTKIKINGEMYVSTIAMEIGLANLLGGVLSGMVG